MDLILCINEERNNNYVYVSIHLFEKKKTEVRKESENKQS